MSKYDNFNDINQNTIENLLVQGESIIWQGKPKKSAFIINKITKMMPIAIFWLLFDLFFIFMSSSAFAEMGLFLIIFFAFHLLPVWIWLSNVLTASKKWKNTEYAVTDKRIIAKTGFIGMDYISVYYKDIKNVRLSVGIIDKMLGVGDIYFDTYSTNFGTNNASGTGTAFLDIEDAYQIYPKVQKVVLDIQTDIEFPNDLRPNTNSGYNTKYNSKF